MADTPAQTPTQEPPAVLELRVHGVNNTTAPALLDLRPDDVEFVEGDDLGSFWRPKDAAVDGLKPRQQGYVPPGIRREAYSWGGMVRTTPSLGSDMSPVHTFTSVLARIGYTLLLPFALGNTVQWTRRLPPPPAPLPDPPPVDPPLVTEKGARTTAGLTRLFGVLLTLLFTCTAITVSLDLGAAQCAAAAALCGPAKGFFEMFAGWTAGQRLALFAFGPILAAGALWALSTLSRQRYDVLPGMGGHVPGVEGLAPDAMPAPPAKPPVEPTAQLTSPGFWSNRVTRHLAHAHFAAAIFFTIMVTAAHAAFRWHTRCTGLGGFDVCIGHAWRRGDFDGAMALVAVGGVGLVITLVVVFLLPTTVVTTEERISMRTARWAFAMLMVAVVAFIALEVVLLLSVGPRRPTELYGAGAAPLTIVTAAAAIAASGIFWRPFAHRAHTAWAGCGPAAFMVFALVIAASTSAIVTATMGDWLNGASPASALVRGVVHRPGVRTPPTLTISSSYIALGVGVLASVIVVALIVGLMLALPRGVEARAEVWGAPTTPDDFAQNMPGVLPPSPRTLLDWVVRRRRLAARVHLAEPIGGAAAIVLGAGLVGGIVWAWVAYGHPGAPLWDPTKSGGWWPAVLRPLLDVSMFALAWVGLALIAGFVAGATKGSARPVAIVWDVICYLPRTGHPYGPPAYAERAVPEIAGRLFEWLDATGVTDPDLRNRIEQRRAVLVGHSMGGVLVVSALALLASSPSTRPVLERISLLTFGVQLRAFFGRIFPELHGPDVLGVQPSLPPRAFGGEDPWAKDFAQPPVDTADGHLRGTLLADYGVRWGSLWRLTDILGFVANSPHPNSIDVFADELDATGYMMAVDGHDVYYRAPEYLTMLERLSKPA